MPKISVIIPVYRAEKYLRRCVESILLGEERDLEVILVEDCSDDGSWELCQLLAEEYEQVICLRNDQNRGVSYTRNRGIDAASGTYVLFVDSDDWVSGSYVKTLIEIQEANPERLVVCNYHFIDESSQSRCIFGVPETTVINIQNLYSMDGSMLLQQLWNKVFSLEQLRRTGIRFDESISMGEDYQFVLDVLEAADYQGCVAVAQPLYYYIRRDNQSLMNSWAFTRNFPREWKQLEQLCRICGMQTVDADRLLKLKERQIYHVVTSRGLSEKLKRQKVLEIMEGKVTLSCAWLQFKYRLIDGYYRLKRSVDSLWLRLSTKLTSFRSKNTVRINRKQFQNGEFSVIAQNCIGGVLCHDMGIPFLTPTVNLFFSATDFLRFVENLESCLSVEPELHWGEEYPVGRIGELEIHYMHYHTCAQAKEDWERRKKRVDLNKILVLTTDRDGFDMAAFERWKKLPYPKVLFTAKKEFADHPDSVYFPKYQKLGCVPDLIPKREFYKDNLLLHKVNQTIGLKR